MCLWVTYKKKYEKKYFFASLKSLKKGVFPELDPDPLVRGTDLQIWIRTKMSRIPWKEENRPRGNISRETCTW